MTAKSFPTTLTSIGEDSFYNCSSIDNVDLLRTNLQELGDAAFMHCTELTSMTIPDSLQTFGGDVFYECFNLVLSHVDIGDVNEVDNVVTADVVHHLRTQQRIAALEKENAAQATEIAVLGARIAQLEIALPTPPSNNFISTIDFKRHFVDFVRIGIVLIVALRAVR